MYVKDVEDRSNTPKGCNAMHVEDVEDGKRTLQAHQYLMDFQSEKVLKSLGLSTIIKYCVY